jgi:adenosylcobinamide-GDP ribazoletransferase
VLRVAALASLSPAAALLALPVVHACSRAATVALLATTPSADTIGLGAQFARGTGAVRATVAVIAAVMLSASLVGLAALAVVAIGVIMSVFVRRIARRRIGGVTGDVLGAAQQLVEVGGLVVLAAVDRTSGMG